MAVGTYFTTAAPTTVKEYLLQSETRVRLGAAGLYGTGGLETSSWVYTTYNASIGLKSGSIDLGLLSSLNIGITSEVETLEAANVRRTGIEFLSNEETTVSIGLREFKTEVLSVLIGSAVMYTLGDERVITWGEGCTLESRPIEIGATNIFCEAPTTPDIALGITALVFTVYDAICTSGINMDLVATEPQSMDLEFRAKPVLTLAAGNRIGSIYAF